MSRREFELPIQDDPSAEAFHNRRAFASTPQRFRQRLASAFGRDTAFPEPNPAPGQRDDYWDHFPWFTPIVGSGPLGLPENFLAQAQQIPDAVKIQVQDLQVFADNPGLHGIGQDELEWAPAFVARLIEERTDLGPPWRSAKDGPVVGDVTLHYLLLSAQLTRLFHRISLDTTRPISRWGTTLAKQQPHSERSAETKREYIDLLIPLTTACIIRLDEARGARFPKGQLEKLLAHIQQNANKGEVALLHAQQVTEIAWNLLIEDIGGDAIYPGWTDLLLELVLDADSAVDNAYRRPRIEELQSIAEHIRRMHGPALSHFWFDPEGGSSQDSRRFYDALAEMLWAQHAARGIERDRKRTTPYATAIVVSFDLELELALVRTARPDHRAFVVLVPMYLSRDYDTDADFVWLEAYVDIVASRADSESVIPKVSKWRAVVGDRPPHELPDLPVVVQLVGSPWFLPPPLADLADEDGNGASGQNLLRDDLERLLNKVGSRLPIQKHKLVPAITLSEYHALLLSRDEWTSEISKGRGIPHEYLLQGDSGPQRYWGVLGVPVRDPAVRARVLSLLSGPFGRSIASSNGGASESRGNDAAAPVAAATDSASPGVAIADPVEARSMRPSGGMMPRRSRPAAVANAPSAPAATVPAPSGPASSSPAPAVAADEGGSRRGSLRRLRGLSVNRQMDDDEVSVLVGLGLNVVLDRCEAFTDDLLEYAGWIDQGASNRG